jgi:hypothetical protein
MLAVYTPSLSVFVLVLTMVLLLLHRMPTVALPMGAPVAAVPLNAKMAKGLSLPLCPPQDVIKPSMTKVNKKSTGHQGAVRSKILILSVRDVGLFFMIILNSQW